MSNETKDRVLSLWREQCRKTEERMYHLNELWQAVNMAQAKGDVAEHQRLQKALFTATLEEFEARRDFYEELGGLYSRGPEAFTVEESQEIAKLHQQLTTMDERYKRTLKETVVWFEKAARGRVQ